MQNVKQELHANPVGANCVRPHFEEITQNKGITLIALIITIIVMLILVGVTINVALNGGLFEKAEDAKTRTQLAADREELQMAVIAALNINLVIPNAQAIKNNLAEEWKVTGNPEGPYTCISPNGNVFEVDKKGNIKPGTIGNETPVEFKWSDVDLKIDTSADYELVASEDEIFLMNFTDEGKLILKLNGEVITNPPIDATESERSETGLLKFNLTIPGVGTSDVTLEMDNEVDIKVNLLATGETQIFKKIIKIELDGKYLLYEITVEDSGTKQMMFVDGTTKKGTVFLAIGDIVFFPFPVQEFRIKNTFEYEGQMRHNVVTGQSLIDTSIPEGYIGEIINEELDLKVVNNDGSVSVLKTQRLPIESEDFIEIYEIEGTTESSGTGLEFKLCYGALEKGECYILYKTCNHYFIISDGMLNYTTENGILRVEQIDEEYNKTGEFEEYIIGTEAIKVK